VLFKRRAGYDSIVKVYFPFRFSFSELLMRMSGKCLVTRQLKFNRGRERQFERKVRRLNPRSMNTLKSWKGMVQPTFIADMNSKMDGDVLIN
jgi:hypothetical protein